MHRSFWIGLALNVVWVNVSTIFRYFLFVRPMMRSAFPMLPDVAEMNPPVFFAWGVWGAIPILSISTISWLMLNRFGLRVSVVLASGTIAWAIVYANLWGATYLMYLAPLMLVSIVLVLGWLEMVIGAFLVRWSMSR